MISVFLLLRRVGRALNVLGSVVGDRELARSLPWPYIRRLLRENRYVQTQIVGGLVVMIALPLLMLLPEEAQALPIGIVFVIFVAAASMRSAHARKLRRIQ